MTDATARREARLADDTGHCGFCGSRERTHGTKIMHTDDCKLVTEHGTRIGVWWPGRVP